MVDDPLPPVPVWEALLARPTTGSGGQGSTRVTFGGGVIDDLIAGLVAHKESVRRPVVLGCVPWLTSIAVADALCDQEAICIVVDKSGTSGSGRMYRAIQRIDDNAYPIDQTYLPGFDLVSSRVNGQPRIIDPSDLPLGEEVGFGPVRVAGWYGKQNLPLLHAKLAVCCDAYFGEDEWGREGGGLRPISCWVGSANWTIKASEHLEIGAWVEDHSLAETALDFLLSLIRISEPLGSQEIRPTPEHAESKLDDDAFADYAAQFGNWEDDDDAGDWTEP